MPLKAPGSRKVMGFDDRSRYDTRLSWLNESAQTPGNWLPHMSLV